MVAAAVVGTAIVGGSMMGASAARKAGSEQAAASERAAELQMEQYQQTRADIAPWRETGRRALSAYEGLFLPQNQMQGPWGGAARGLGTALGGEDYGAGDDRYAGFYESPGYQFRFGEGLRALDRSAAARGRLQGGGYGREMQRYGQGMASQEFGNYANRLAGLAGVGQTAATQTGQLGQQMAGQAGGAMQQAGAARASGYVGAANAITGGIQTGAMLYGMGGFGGGAPAPNYGYGPGGVWPAPG